MQTIIIDELDAVGYENKLRENYSEVQVRWVASGTRFSGKAKVVRINPKSITVELLEPVRGTVGSIPIGHIIKVPRSTATNWSMHNGVFPVDCPKEPVVPNIKIQIGETTRIYELFQTNAPKAYDYDYVINLHYMDDTERFVAIPKESVAYQTGRYRSGMHFIQPIEEFLIPELETMFWRRIAGHHD